MRLYDIDDDEAPPPRKTPAVEYFVAEDIGAGLGRVGLDDAGRLAGVELDERAMRSMDRARVGGYLVAAINRATDKAKGRNS